MIDRSSAKRYEEDIGAIDEMLQDVDEAELSPAFAAAMEGLRNRRDELVAQREELGDRGMASHDLAVVLTGRPVVGQTVDSEFLSDVLRDIQDVVRAFVAALAGKKTTAGPIPAKLQRISTLRFAGSFGGSFGMSLETADEQREMELEGSAPVADALSNLVQLIASGDDPDNLLDGLGSLGERARSHYARLLTHVGASSAKLEIAWPSVSQGTQTAAITASKAKRAVDVLERVQEKTRYETRVGVLTGGNIRLGTFEFVDDEAEVIQGRISGDLSEDLELGHRYKATVHVTELTYAATRRPKRHYRLDEIEIVQGDESSEG